MEHDNTKKCRYCASQFHGLAKYQWKLHQHHAAGSLLVIALQGCQGSLLELPQLLLGLFNVCAVHRALLQSLNFGQEPLPVARHTKGRVVRESRRRSGLLLK